MRKVIASAVIILMASLGLAIAQNSSETSGSGRKIVSRVAPVCPELARRMHIQGTVRLEALVKPNGSVKTTRVLGGNPVLVEAATTAVTKWKFEAAPNETTEVVQLVFVAQ
jgi:TonB family protein